MQTKRLNFLGSFFAAVFILSMAACAPLKPADPAYRWASGNWIGETSYGQSADAQFRVINGNQLTGYVTYHSISGRIAEGTILSGFVDKKELRGDIYWASEGMTTDLSLFFLEGGLHGGFAFNRQVELRKAK